MAEPAEPQGVKEADGLSSDRRFQELCTHIRTTDDISFKLLGLVPLISGAGIAAVFMKGEAPPSAAVYLLCLFAAAVSLALFCWELRNIQICTWLRDRAAELESASGGQGAPRGHFLQLPEARLGLGKTEAEVAVYAVTITAWLLLPWFLGAPAAADAIAAPDAVAPDAGCSTAGVSRIYAAAACCIGVATWALAVVTVLRKLRGKEVK